jgi:hypothetical protein
MRTSKSKSAIRRVALIYDATLVYDLKVMVGVAAYIQEKADYRKLAHFPSETDWCDGGE